MENEEIKKTIRQQSPSTSATSNDNDKEINWKIKISKGKISCGTIESHNKIYDLYMDAKLFNQLKAKINNEISLSFMECIKRFRSMTTIPDYVIGLSFSLCNNGSKVSMSLTNNLENNGP